MKSVIVIGASSGIGEGIAVHYAKMGCKVAITARREDKLKEVANLFPNNIIYECMDVTSEGDLGFSSLIERLGGVDLVVYCSGAGEHSTSLDIKRELNTVNVNIDGFLKIATASFNYFLKKERSYKPQFVVICSVASTMGLGPAASYSASKGFQVVYMDAMAQLAASRGLDATFTTIKPGFVRTNFIKGVNYPLLMSLDYVVKRIISAIEGRKSSAIIDWRWAIVVGFWKLIPRCLWRRIKL